MALSLEYLFSILTRVFLVSNILLNLSVSSSNSTLFSPSSTIVLSFIIRRSSLSRYLCYGCCIEDIIAIETINLGLEGEGLYNVLVSDRISNIYIVNIGYIPCLYIQQL